LAEYPKVEAILCSQAEAGKMLAIGKTKLGELIARGELESVRIGARRLVRISSVRRLAGVEPDQQGEAA
jgi:excisionase family DNA binding protein